MRPRPDMRTAVALLLAAALAGSSAAAQSLRPETARRAGARPETARNASQPIHTPAPPPIVGPGTDYPGFLYEYDLHRARPPAPPAASAPAEPRERGVVLLREGEFGDDGFLEVVGDTPGATVFVDGREVGPTPLRKARIASGERRVRVAKYGYKRFERAVAVEPGKVVRLTVTLKRIK